MTSCCDVLAPVRGIPGGYYVKLDAAPKATDMQCSQHKHNIGANVRRVQIIDAFSSERVDGIRLARGQGF